MCDTSFGHILRIALRRGASCGEIDAGATWSLTAQPSRNALLVSYRSTRYHRCCAHIRIGIYTVKFVMARAAKPDS